MKTLITILLLSLSSFAQTFVGSADDNAFFIDQVKKKKGGVTFVLIQTPYQFENGKVKPDPDNFIMGLFHADCMSMDYFSTDSTGKFDGVKGKVKETSGTAESPMVIWYAIDAACKEK
jgi:hypothetical protein